MRSLNLSIDGMSFRRSLICSLENYHQANRPEIVIAVESRYLPRGGEELIWFYHVGNRLEGHSCFWCPNGSIRVTRASLDVAVVRSVFSQTGFFELADRPFAGMDGCPFTVAAIDGQLQNEFRANLGHRGGETPHDIVYRTLTDPFRETSIATESANEGER